jgi:hypothetical protein
MASPKKSGRRRAGEPGPDPAEEDTMSIFETNTTRFEQLTQPAAEDTAVQHPQPAPAPSMAERPTLEQETVQLGTQHAAAPAPEQAPPGWEPPRQTAPSMPPRRPGRGKRPAAIAAAAVIAGLLAGAAFAGPSFYGPAEDTATIVPVSTAAEAAAPTATTTAPADTAAPAAANPAPAVLTGKVDVARKGYTQLPPEPDGDRKVTYAAVLRNTERDKIALDVRAVITFTGRGGAVLDVKDEQIDTLLPGATGAIADDTELAGVTGMKVAVQAGRWVPAKGITGKLTIGRAQSRSIAGELTTSATITSTLNRPIDDADVTVVYYDRSGRVLGGHSESADLIPGSAAPVSIDSSTIPSGIAKAEIHAVPQDLFED